MTTTPFCYFDTKQSIRYGHTVVDNNDPYVRLVEEASQSTSEAAVPGAFMVDLFPSCTVIYYDPASFYSNIFPSEIRPRMDARCWIQDKG